MSSTRFAWSNGHSSSYISIYTRTIKLLQCCPDQATNVDPGSPTKGVACCDLKPHNCISESIRALHWLPIKQRINFKLCLLVQHTVNRRAPPYLQDLITSSVAVPHLSTLRSAMTASHRDFVLQISTRISVIDHSLWLGLVHETLFQ